MSVEEQMMAGTVWDRHLVLCHSLKLRYNGLLVRRQILAPTDWKSIVQVSTQL